MPSAATLIDDLGGSTVVASAIGHDATAVRMMKHRNRIPRSVWPDLQLAFPDRATLTRLLETETVEAAGSKP